MKITPIGSNKTLRTLDNGTQILYSYSTPVAAFIPGRGHIRTDKFHSVTTSRHINKWLDEAEAEIVPQSQIDALAK